MTPDPARIQIQVIVKVQPLASPERCMLNCVM